MRQCIDCRYSHSSGTAGYYNCYKHGGTFDPFEHPTCSDFSLDDDSECCFSCDYYTKTIFGTEKCTRRDKKICGYDRACPYFKDY